MKKVMKKGYIEKGTPGVRKYQAWINRNTSAIPDRVRGTCRLKAEAMAAAFPELEVVGVSRWYFGHAWCITKDGRVVDPTAHQFASPYRYPKSFLRIEDFPTGKCHWCGELEWPDTPGVRAYLGEEVEYTTLGPHDECRKAFLEECAELDPLL